jgi:hypothetical protein
MGYIGLLWLTLGHLGSLWDMYIYIYIYIYTHIYIGSLWDILIHSGIYSLTLGCIGSLWDVQAHFGICRLTLGYIASLGAIWPHNRYLFRIRTKINRLQCIWHAFGPTLRAGYTGWLRSPKVHPISSSRTGLLLGKHLRAQQQLSANQALKLANCSERRWQVVCTSSDLARCCQPSFPALHVMMHVMMHVIMRVTPVCCAIYLTLHIMALHTCTSPPPTAGPDCNRRHSKPEGWSRAGRRDGGDHCRRMAGRGSTPALGHLQGEFFVQSPPFCAVSLEFFRWYGSAERPHTTQCFLG